MGCGNCFGKREPPEYEPPYSIEPPKRRRKVLFEDDKYKRIDKHASKVALRHLKKDLEKLVNHLRKPVDDEDDLGMLRALFVWITRLKLDDILEKGIPEGHMPQPDSPLDFLSNLKANLINHATFFQILCKQANIPCEVVTGIAKNASYKVGHHLKHNRLKSQWNAVYVSGEWRFVDVHWASHSSVGSKSTDWVIVNMKQAQDEEEEEGDNSSDSELPTVNDYYFLTDPDMFICTHFPDNPKWQLLPQEVPLSRFETSVYIRDKFFTLGLSVSDVTKRQCVLQTVDGMLELGFGISESKSLEAAFRFLFYNYKTEFQFDPGYTLEHYVLNTQSIDAVNFTLRFPRSGTFRFDIFGREKSRALFDLVSSYVIQCPTPKPKCLPLPFIPATGWGPTIACHKMGIQPVTHKRAVIQSPDGIVHIKFRLVDTLWMKFLALATGVESWLLEKTVVAWREDDMVIMQTRFREEGEYALNIVASKSPSERKIENVCNYLISVQSSSNLGEYPLLRGCMLGANDLTDHFKVYSASNDSAFFRTSDRNFSLTMTMDENVEMLAEITNNDIASSVMYTNVTREQTSGRAVFHFELPSKDEFGINLYVRRHGENHAVYHVYTYYVIIEPESQTNSQNSLQDERESKGHSSAQSEPVLSQYSNDEKSSELIVPVSVATAKKHVTAKIVTRQKPMCCQLCPEETSPDPISKLNISTKSRNNFTLFTVGLPTLGKYNLNVFEEVYPGFIYMFAYYNIQRSKTVTEEVGEVAESLTAEEKKRILLSMKRDEQIVSLKRSLRVGLRTKNTKLLKHSLKQMKELQIEDDEEELMAQAQDMLEWLKLKDALTKAMSDRDRKRLEYLLDSVANNDLVSKMSVEVAAAKRLLEYLNRLERLKRLRQQRVDVMNLDAPTMAEIRSYSKPPVPVFMVLVATCVILGEDSEDLQNWSDVKKIISQSGKMSLQHRVYHYDTEGLTAEMAQDALEILKDMALEDIMAVSPAAATFYVWAKGTAEEARLKSQANGKQQLEHKPISKNLQNFHSIVSNYYAARKGRQRDEFENLEAKFAENPQPRTSEKILTPPPPKISNHDGTLARKLSLQTISPTPSMRKEASDAERLEAVKSVWSTMEEEF